MKTDNCYRNHKNCNSNFCELDQKNPKTEKQNEGQRSAASHTPTPWTHPSPDSTCIWSKSLNAHIVIDSPQMKNSEESAANMAFIVKAVNAYDEDQRKIRALVKAAKSALRQTNINCTDQETGERPYELLKAAIAQAERKS